MIKQDFLLVQIEELAKKLAKLLKKKETPGSNTDTLADDCYKDTPELTRGAKCNS